MQMPRLKSQDGTHPVDRHVGRRIAEKRLILGHSQTALARAVKLTFQKIQKYEKGENRVSASKLWEAANFLGVEIDYFFEGLAGGPTGSDIPVPLDSANPPTRASAEIAGLSRRLSPRQQKLVCELMTALSRTSD